MEQSSRLECTSLEEKLPNHQVDVSQFVIIMPDKDEKNSDDMINVNLEVSGVYQDAREKLILGVLEEYKNRDILLVYLKEVFDDFKIHHSLSEDVELKNLNSCLDNCKLTEDYNVLLGFYKLYIILNTKNVKKGNLDFKGEVKDLLKLDSSSELLELILTDVCQNERLKLRVDKAVLYEIEAMLVDVLENLKEGSGVHRYGGKCVDGLTNQSLKSTLEALHKFCLADE